MDAMSIRSEYISGALDDIVRDRRALHAIPETAHEEYLTHAYLMEQLSALEPDMLSPIAGTGIRCVFMGRAQVEGARRTIALRADMDALGVSENTGREFCSTRPGFMHACGHDGHMATMLAVARFCARNRERLRDNVVILFQPAEEADGGAELIIAADGLENPHVDEVYGMHVMPTLPSGTIACPDGPLMASACEMDIVISGRAAHGAMPHLGNDALAAAVALYGMLQTVFTRQTDPFERKVFTVGAMEAGTRRNVVAERAVMHATLRTYSDELEARCMELIRSHCEAIERAYGVSCRIDVLTRYLPVINDPHAASRVREAAGDMCVDTKPLMIAEDFSFYQRRARGAFFFCGTAKDGRYDSPLHASDFDLDEASLLNGLKVFIGLMDII